MSLAVAIWKDSSTYAIAADRRVTRAGGDGMNADAPKVHRFGPWFVAVTGGLPASQRLVRALYEPETGGLEAMLLAAWDSALVACGPTSPGEYPRTGSPLLVVGPSGIVELDGYGCLIWTPRPGRGNPRPAYAALGCACEYAMGYLDACEPVELWHATSVIVHAIERFPAVGGPIDSLDSTS